MEDETVVFTFSQSFSMFSRLCNQSRDRFGVTPIYLWRIKILKKLSGNDRMRLADLGDQVDKWRKLTKV